MLAKANVQSFGGERKLTEMLWNAFRSLRLTDVSPVNRG